MILALSTKDETCRMTLLDAKGNTISRKEWLAKRDLARDLLTELEQFLAENNGSFKKLTSLIFFKGPGSFTGLRIGATVISTLAYSLDLPIVGSEGEQWVENGVERLASNQNDRLVMPEYGSLPHITQPKK